MTRASASSKSARGIFFTHFQSGPHGLEPQAIEEAAHLQLRVFDSVIPVFAHRLHFRAELFKALDFAQKSFVGVFHTASLVSIRSWAVTTVVPLNSALAASGNT
jgi:hypothetical protein